MTNLGLVTIRLLLFLLLLLYGVHHLSNTADVSTVHRSRAIAVSAHLQILHETPLELWDLSGMADRITSLTTLLEAMISDPSVDRKPLLSHLESQFPWWNSLETSYTPWSKALTGTVTETKGIVICVKSSDTLLAGHLISALRNVFDSRLPIEIAYNGEDDLPYGHRKGLLAIDPTLQMINLFDHFNSSVMSVKGDYASMVPFAFLASRFQKVVLVDPDTIFLQAPDQLFQTHAGALFFHDRAYIRGGKFSRRDWVAKLLRDKRPSKTLNETLFWRNDLWEQMRAGVVYIDKGRATTFMSFVFAAWMNTRLIHESVIGPHIDSKETIWLAAELSSTLYSFSDSYASIIGKAGERLDARTHRFSQNLCSTQTLHLDSKKRPFWLSGSLRRKKSSPSHEFADFTHWIDGGQRMEWQNQGDEFWCAEGEMMGLEGTEWGYRIERMREEARWIDGHLHSLMQ
ncbi:hypothetical protein MMC14_004686 [Varicellaria rhodocarpa]|nr:hypothetical protein [Varicellaria rhodocarpa]